MTFGKDQNPYTPATWNRNHPPNHSGEHNGNARLKREDIFNIRISYRALIKNLARRYNITERHVQAIIRKERWNGRGNEDAEQL